MPKTNDKNSPSLGMCRRLIDFIVNNFPGQGYKRLPSSGITIEDSSRNMTGAVKSYKSNGQEVVVDFRHIEDPKNRPSIPSGTPANANGRARRRPEACPDGFLSVVPGKTGALVKSQKGSQQIKVNPGGIIQRNGPRSMIIIEEGRAKGGGEEGRKKEKTTLESEDGIGRVPSNINEKADAFIRSRRETMSRNLSSVGLNPLSKRDESHTA